jgi:hypothetical protein
MGGLAKGDVKAGIHGDPHQVRRGGVRVNWDITTSTFGSMVTQELLRILLGPKIGEGVARQVFRHPQRSDLVIKVESVAHSFQNIHEWTAWEQVKHTKWAKYFAPCVEISSTGVVLIQQYAKPLPDDLRTLKLPNLLCDFKPENYGLIDDQVVARDYGVGNFFANGIGATRLRTIRPDRWTERPEGE